MAHPSGNSIIITISIEIDYIIQVVFTFSVFKLKHVEEVFSLRYQNYFQVLRIQTSVFSLILKTLDLPTII